MREIIIRVEGMSCQHCVSAIEKGVGNLNGVSSVKVDLDQGDATVAFDENEISEERIKEAIEDVGYDVVQ